MLKTTNRLYIYIADSHSNKENIRQGKRSQKEIQRVRIVLYLEVNDPSFKVGLLFSDCANCYSLSG